MIHSTHTTPTITLGGIALPSDSLTWALRTGLAPHTARILVPLQIHTQLLQHVTSPTTLVLDATRCGGPLLTFEGIRLIGFTRAAGGSDMRWTLADARATWRGQRISGGGSFNIPGELNDSDLNDDHRTAPAPATTTTGNEPTFPAARYHARSLNPATQQPWTALQLATHLLDRLAGDAGFSTTTSNGAALADNGVIAPALELGDGDGDDSAGHELLDRTLPALLAEAGVDVAAFADGTLRLVPKTASITAYAPAGAAAAVTAGSAGVARVDAKALRPREVIVRVPTEVQREFRFVRVDETTTTSDAQPAGTRLINVLRLPGDEQSLRAWGERSARTLPAGSFVPVDDALAAWGLRDADVREGWFVGGLERKFAGGDESAWSAEWLQRIRAIREHWRRTFAIHPDDLRELRAWRPARLSQPDRRTKRASRSMAMAAHTLVPAVRPPAKVLAAVGSVDGSAGRVVVVQGDVPFGEVEVIDAASGVFRVRTAADGELATVPGTVGDVPAAVLQSSARSWANAVVESEWELRVVLAVLPAAESERWHELRIEGDGSGAAGAVRVDVREEFSRVLDGAGDVALVVLNRGVVQAMAERAARTVWRAHQPAWRGALQYDGLWELPAPGADVRRVAWSVSCDGVMTTEVSFVE